MSEFCLALLTNLLRTTAFLSATAIVVGLVLKLSRCQSPRVHRVAWCLVLFQGLLSCGFPGRFTRRGNRCHWQCNPRCCRATTSR